MNFMNTYIFSVDSNGQTYKHYSTDKKLHIGQRTGDPLQQLFSFLCAVK